MRHAAHMVWHAQRFSGDRLPKKHMNGFLMEEEKGLNQEGAAARRKSDK